MSFIQDIFDLVEDSQYFEEKKSRHMIENAFDKAKEIIDKYYNNQQKNIIHHTEISYCICGCQETQKFWDLINLPDNFFKLIFEYCVQKNYIIINTELEHSLCRKLIRQHIDNHNIQIILWLIENVISTEKLNEFLFDYDNDKDYTESITKKECPRRYFSLFQPFYNNQFYDTTQYLPQIFHVFRQKKFNFAQVSEKCCHSLVVSAINNWDVYSTRLLLSEGCKFDEECYNSMVNIICTSLCKLRNKIDDTKYPKKYYDGSWSNVEKLLYEKIYEDEEMLVKIFCSENVGYDKKDDSEQNKELIKMIEIYSDEKLSHLEDYQSMKKDILRDISTYYGRSFLVRPENSLQEIYELIELCISYGIDLRHECYPFTDQGKNKSQMSLNYLDVITPRQLTDTYQLSNPTFLNGYLHGCKPIKLIYPEWHEKFIKLLTS